MASGQTEHYGLSQWAAEDSFLREEFNEDFRNIDEAIYKGAELVFGCYLGQYAEGKESIQAVGLGFRPKLALIVPSDGSFTDTSGRKYGCLIGPNQPMYTGDPESGWAARVNAEGFEVCNNRNHQLMNISGRTYYYLALRQR